ncbi:protein phosphatase 1 regulatory subunit 12C-like isoform X2 [Arctopsyche grandis]|uniref:protein phosphatase 1 regulatory subunit 12C-like isoform X2 n=1 Tax=Arctopsyche grandis TaxID=121162 RepID=UPI00406D99B4
MEDHRRMKTREAEAVARRDEQLRNYHQSDMYLQVVREHLALTIRFAWDSMFHAACAAADRDEVVRLLNLPGNAEVNCLNVDGLSALHQAAINNNLEMVEFLVNLGADVNVEDRESWTPLHATVNCGHLSITRYLIDRGANLGAINSDGHLPIDIAESDEMKALIQEAVAKQGIDCDLARKVEERVMTADAIRWAIEAHAYRQSHPEAGKVDPETGTSALHVAAAKGYMQVIRLLIKCCKVEINVQDSDGWSPLHAASYWGQKDAVETLMASSVNTSLVNNKGETFVDIANDDMVEFIRKLEKEQRNRKHRRMSRGPYDYESIKTRDKDIPTKKGKSCGITCEVARIDEEIALLDKAESWAADDLNPEAGLGDPDTGRTPLHKAAAKGYMKLMEVLVTRCYVDVDVEDNEGWTPLHIAGFHGQKDAAAFLISWGALPTIKNKRGHTCIDVSTDVMGQHISWLVMKAKGRRRQATLPDEVSIMNKRRELKNKIIALNTSPARTENSDYSSSENDVNFESNKPKTGTPVKLVEQTPPEAVVQEPVKKSEVPPPEITSTENENTHEPQVKPVEISSDEEPKKRSFVPPARDEESATQRKAHAKRARETRRSTQGISLEEIQNAEMLIRKNANEKAQTNAVEKPVEDGVSSASSADPIANSGQSQKSFALEDVTKEDGESNQNANASNATPNTNVTEVSDTVTLPLRRPVSNDEKLSDRLRNSKYSEAGGPKNNIRRRSTGISQITLDQNDDSPKKISNNDDSTIDYKKLYERSQLEIERLNKIIKSYDEQPSKGLLEKPSFMSSQDLSTEKEKREKRALQRKLSEMEEELRQQKALQTENQRLKDENGALIRVISKLSK